MPPEFTRSVGVSRVENGTSGMDDVFLSCPKCRRGVYVHYPIKVQGIKIEVRQVLSWVNTEYPGCPEYPIKGIVNHPSWGTIEVPREAFVNWNSTPETPRKNKTSAA